MDLNGYLDPVSLERPTHEYLPREDAFSHHITVHTPDQPIRELDKHQVALIGVPVDKNAFSPGSRTAPDQIRSCLYQLRRINQKLRIYDLGNLKNGDSVNDTYYALRDLVLELHERDIVTLVLGGSQDLSRGVFQALEKIPGLHQVITLDSMLDYSPGDEIIHSRNYLNYILEPTRRKRFIYGNLGHQAYFISEQQLDELESSGLESLRLGEVRDQIEHSEPLIRDASFVSIDMGAVRHSDAPGSSTPSPNGFFGHELCRMTRYAGMSEKVRFLGFFEINPSADINGQTAHLAAQASWYFLDGLSHRILENPMNTPEHMKKFIIAQEGGRKDMIFHKSTLSDRWWMEIPVKNPLHGYNFFVSCSYEDYQMACKQEIPDRWWRFLKRLSNELE